MAKQGKLQREKTVTCLADHQAKKCGVERKRSVCEKKAPKLRENEKSRHPNIQTKPAAAGRGRRSGRKVTEGAERCSAGPFI